MAYPNLQVLFFFFFFFFWSPHQARIARSLAHVQP
ncbi:hypothetical protein PoMZ_07762 [Pyricularia oryzae]|uniref:Uncharacterized protein n=1 Tax=Pyricularia oryzae TaxID=318829 RepID=A0A4P7NFY3_PYROR|nr:hypothetical protein PoMZ_07762 [Pyricularia oryzae]